ncbi:hypothetical protein [Streptomyces sp. NPDC127108]|uniref:hypothetical protein n=1 Tax=Streptomyces sp. NPDC127108 TaxID=3345361 RepID=UPI0036402250
MYRPAHVRAAALLALLLTAGCTSDGDASRADAGDAPRRPSGAASADRGNEEEAARSDAAKALALPAHPRFLVKVRTGAGAAPLPDFTPSKDAYTVHVTCTGAKSVKIATRDGAKDTSVKGSSRKGSSGKNASTTVAPTTVRCDSPLTVGQVHTAPGRQRLAVSAEDGARWTLAVVDGRGDL